MSCITFLERALELPAVIGRVVVVRRDEDLNPVLLRCLEEGFEVLDGPVLGHALADQVPGRPFGTQKVVLGIRDQQCRVLGSDLNHCPPPLGFDSYGWQDCAWINSVANTVFFG